MVQLSALGLLLFTADWHTCTAVDQYHTLSIGQNKHQVGQQEDIKKRHCLDYAESFSHCFGFCSLRLPG